MSKYLYFLFLCFFYIFLYFFCPEINLSRFLQKSIGAFQKIYIHKNEFYSEWKANRKIVTASYTTDAVFKHPDGLDLENKTVVESW